MIDFHRYTLDNGLTVLLHRDPSTPLATVNVLYKVGSRNEDPKKTGFAHLFEHLMFGGSENVPDYDTPMQVAGGENNAFTNSDMTNFFNTVPAQNIETALWLESDRMMKLDFNQKSLDIQKKVVVEEFKETSINQPYGDLWHKLSKLAYTEHPYRWPTIGMKMDHIEDAILEDVESFFYQYYKPNNAVLVIAGNFETEEIKIQINKWFGSLKSSPVNLNPIPKEPVQKTFRTETVTSAVPNNTLYMAFHMPDRNHKDFIAFDILTDIMSGGRSSRFYRKLMKATDLFADVDAYITGTLDPGLLLIEAKLMDDTEVAVAKEIIWKELELLKKELVPEKELKKVKNSLISSVTFSEVSVQHKAINLAFYEYLGDADLINHQEEEIEKVTPEDLLRISNEVFKKENCSEIIYLKKK